MSGDSKASWPGWETVKLIGQGSFGAVYEIQRDVFGDVEKAALKVITIPQNASDIEELYSDGYDDESITSTFQNHLKNIVAEYSLMRKMNGCSNVVNCDDIRYIRHDDGIGWDIFIKMELLTPLTKAVAAQCSEATVVKIAKDMCVALELCKKHEIIHRDIKPQNIFVSPNGDYKLGDFGIAKTVEKTMGGTKIGTYKYMAPEVYHYQPYGHSADIYSLGLVLYWLLNERRMPFLPLPPAKLSYGMEEKARDRRFNGEQLPPPAHGSAALQQIVLKACAYAPKMRYQTATEMLRDIENIGMQAKLDPQKSAPAPAQNSWECVYGRKYPNNVNSCVCGTSNYAARECAPTVNKDNQDTGVEKIQRDVLQPNTGRIKSVTEKSPEGKQTDEALPSGFWRCVCGRKNAVYVSSCACGASKRDVVGKRTQRDVACPVCGHKQEGQQVCWRCGYSFSQQNSYDSEGKETANKIVTVWGNAAGEVVCPTCGHRQKGHYVCWKCGQKFSIQASHGND